MRIRPWARKRRLSGKRRSAMPRSLLPSSGFTAQTRCLDTFSGRRASLYSSISIFRLKPSAFSIPWEKTERFACRSRKHFGRFVSAYSLTNMAFRGTSTAKRRPEVPSSQQCCLCRDYVSSDSLRLLSVASRKEFHSVECLRCHSSALLVALLSSAGLIIPASTFSNSPLGGSPRSCARVAHEYAATLFFLTPRPSQYDVASADCAEMFPWSAAFLNNANACLSSRAMPLPRA